MADSKQLQSSICALCLTQFANYTCPRCNILYCSLSCYRNENHAQCSESFYRDNVLCELQQMQSGSQERSKVMEMLQRLEEEDSQLSEDGTAEASDTRSLEERLAGLDLDKDEDEVWKRLTPSEQREFHHMVHKGAESQAPWWEVADQVVKPLASGGEEDLDAVIPRLPPDLPSLDTLIKSGPVSPFICYNVVNVLYAYAYTVRLYNSAHHELPREATQTLLDISSCLSSNACFESVRSALYDAMDTISKKPSICNSHGFSAAVMKDVTGIMCCPRSHDCLVSRALADAHKLLGLARSNIRAAAKDSGEADITQPISQRIWLARKKVFFYLVWASMPGSVYCYRDLAKIVNLECEVMVYVATTKHLEEKEVGTGLTLVNFDTTERELATMQSDGNEVSACQRMAESKYLVITTPLPAGDQCGSDTQKKLIEELN